MILIPALETVLLLPPRTASGSLYRAVMARHPASMLLYRHMEADGIPAPYTRWRKVGVVREPLARLWSLYKFCRDMPARPDIASRYPAYASRIGQSARRGFSEWIVSNETIFTDAFVTDGSGYHPGFAQLHALPETRKSQWLTLRPDLGTEVVPFHHLSLLARRLDVTLAPEPHNATWSMAVPAISPDAGDHIGRFFAWDIAAVRGDVRTVPEGKLQAAE